MILAVSRKLLARHMSKQCLILSFATVFCKTIRRILSEPDSTPIEAVMHPPSISKDNFFSSNVSEPVCIMNGKLIASLNDTQNSSSRSVEIPCKKLVSQKATRLRSYLSTLFRISVMTFLTGFTL